LNDRAIAVSGENTVLQVIVGFVIKNRKTLLIAIEMMAINNIDNIITFIIKLTVVAFFA